MKLLQNSITDSHLHNDSNKQMQTWQLIMAAKVND